MPCTQQCQWQRLIKASTMMSLSLSLRAQFLRPRCCRCEVSFTGDRCSSSRLFSIGFSTSQAHDLSISKSCSQPSPPCLWSVVADSPFSSRKSGKKCDLQHQWRSITFFQFWSSNFLFLSQYSSNFQSDQIASQMYPY